MDFTNKVVLVTGASAGIGEATAKLFAQYGARLALVARDEPSLRAVAAACQRARGLAPLVLLADLGTDEGCERTAKETIDHFGQLDVLVNNAGVGCRTSLERADMATFDRVFATNVRGVYNLTRLLVPALMRARGNVVNVSSVSGSMVAVGSLPYGMSKAALDHFTKLVAAELGPKGVRVNAVSPGVTVSKFMPRMLGYSDQQYADVIERTAARIPLGRACAAEDVAHTIAHLASDRSALITGAIVPIDGGLSFGNVFGNELMAQQMNDYENFQAAQSK